MYRYCILILFLSYNVLSTRISEECVTYNFEENEKANFTNTYGICLGMNSWDVGEFSSLPLESPHRDSTVFIKPKTTLSCISSFKFNITGSGVIELNVYIEPNSKTDQITLLVFQSLPGAVDATVGNAVLSPNAANFVPGWQTLRITIVGISRYEGYITLLGMASETSTVLVDSFRYIAPDYDINSCVIYPEDGEKTTTEIEIEITDVPTTIEVHTTKPAGEPSTITIPAKTTTKNPPTIPVTTTTEILPTTPSDIPSTIPSDKPTTITNDISTNPSADPTTIPSQEPTTWLPDDPNTIPAEELTTRSTEKPTTLFPTTVTIPDTTTEKLTTQSSSTILTPGTSTERPRLSVSILLIKIRKYFR